MEQQTPNMINIVLAVGSIGGLLLVIVLQGVRRFNVWWFMRGIKNGSTDLTRMQPSDFDWLELRDRQHLIDWLERRRRASAIAEVLGTQSAAGAAPTGNGAAKAPALRAPVVEPVPAITPLAQALAAIPAFVALEDLPIAASTTAIPLGIDATGTARWADLTRDALHIGIYGQSGAGKDSLLRAWFAVLALRNTPEAVQFAIIDGKGDWLVPQLGTLAHMFLPPAGGYGKLGDAAIKQAVAAVDAEAARRQGLITAAGCRTRDEYNQIRPQTPLPLLVVVATDVMTSIVGDVEGLIEGLVSKARALGIRVIVSMQTPTGHSTRWRMNLSTVLTGNLQHPSQDEVALGIPPRDLRYRPSQLPGPLDRPGVFVARLGAEQIVLQTPFLAEAAFDQICGRLPQRVVIPEWNPRDGADLLRDLLVRETMVAEIAAAPVAVTSQETDLIRRELARGVAPGKIAKSLPNYRGPRYGEYLAKVRYVQEILEAENRVALTQQTLSA